MSGVTSKTGIANLIQTKFAGDAAMDGKAGTILRKLLDGRRLSAIESQVAASTGLGAAVADLVKATKNAQGSQGGLMAVKNTADVFVKTRAVGRALSEADGVYAQNNQAYAKASQAYRSSALGQASAKTLPARDKLFQLAGDTVTVAGTALSAIALPEMAKKTKTSYQELRATLVDPNATTDQQLDKTEALVRSGAGTIFTTQGLVTGLKGVGGIVSRNRTMGEVLTKVGQSKITRFVTGPAGKVLKVAMPVADGAVFVGEAIAMRRTLRDPNATFSQKARKALDLGLASIKAGSYFIPQLKALYGVASFGQLGLTLYDFQKEMGPKLKVAAQKAWWGITHPVQGLRAAGAWAGRTVSGAVTGVAKGVAWLGGKLLSPIESLKKLGAELNLWKKVAPVVAAAPDAPVAPAESGALPAPGAYVPVGGLPAGVALPPAAEPVPSFPAPVATLPQPVVPAVDPYAGLPPAAPVADPYAGLSAPVAPVVAAPAPVLQAPVAAPAGTVTEAPTADAAYQAALAQLG